jgi:Tyrosine phosphatase family
MSAENDLIQGNAVTYKQTLDLHSIAQAVEDLPPEAQGQVVGLASAPESLSLRHRIIDELENGALDAYGNLERAPLLHFLSHYPVKSYTYEISGVMSRGDRPGPQKLRDLFSSGGGQATVNLCAEMADGDIPIISQAGLAGDVRTFHIPVVDMETPQPEQVIELLSVLCGPGSPRTYVHCEAGMGRTGVMTACYRMAVMGWDASDALAEAKNFGCTVPKQQAFIGDFGVTLADQYQARSGGTPGPYPWLAPYPLLPPGSVKATPQELATTLASVAILDEGQAP